MFKSTVKVLRMLAMYRKRVLHNVNTFKMFNLYSTTATTKILNVTYSCNGNFISKLFFRTNDTVSLNWL